MISTSLCAHDIPINDFETTNYGAWTTTSTAGQVFRSSSSAALDALGEQIPIHQQHICVADRYLGLRGEPVGRFANYFHLQIK